MQATLSAEKLAYQVHVTMPSYSTYSLFHLPLLSLASFRYIATHFISF